jgi:hypothetical protein
VPDFVPLPFRHFLLNLRFGRYFREFNRFQCSPFRFHTNVAVSREHLPGDVTGDVHNRLIASTAFGQLGDERVPRVVEASFHTCTTLYILPCCFDRGDWAGRVHGATITLLRSSNASGEQEPTRLDCTEAVRIPARMVHERGEQTFVQRNRTSVTSITLAFSYNKEPLFQIDLHPRELSDLTSITGPSPACLHRPSQRQGAEK